MSPREVSTLLWASSFLICEMELKGNLSHEVLAAIAWLKRKEEGWTEWLSRSFPIWGSVVLASRSPASQVGLPLPRSVDWRIS